MNNFIKFNNPLFEQETCFHYVSPCAPRELQNAPRISMFIYEKCVLSTVDSNTFVAKSKATGKKYIVKLCNVDYIENVQKETRIRDVMNADSNNQQLYAVFQDNDVMAMVQEYFEIK